MDRFHCIYSLNFFFHMCFELHSYLEIKNEAALGVVVRKTHTGHKLQHRETRTEGTGLPSH